MCIAWLLINVKVQLLFSGHWQRWLFLLLMIKQRPSASIPLWPFPKHSLRLCFLFANSDSLVNRGLSRPPSFVQHHQLCHLPCSLCPPLLPHKPPNTHTVDSLLPRCVSQAQGSPPRPGRPPSDSCTLHSSGERRWDGKAGGVRGTAPEPGRSLVSLLSQTRVWPQAGHGAPPPGALHPGF